MHETNEANAIRAQSKLAEMSQPQSGGCGVAGRQNTKDMLLQGAERLRREAHQLEALAYQVEHITGDAEVMLYRLLSAHIFR